MSAQGREGRVRHPRLIHTRRVLIRRMWLPFGALLVRFWCDFFARHAPVYGFSTTRATSIFILEGMVPLTYYHGAAALKPAIIRFFETVFGPQRAHAPASAHVRRPFNRAGRTAHGDPSLRASYVRHAAAYRQAVSSVTGAVAPHRR